MSSPMGGGWSNYREPTREELNIFNQAIHNQSHPVVGVNYKPLAVATQVVEGMNYSFFCNATPETHYPLHEAAIVDIWMDSEQTIKLTDIHKVTH